MTYFLDFDKTLFDVLRAVPYLLAKPECAGLVGPPYRFALDALVVAGALSLHRGELTPYLFPDAEAFVQNHDCIIVTAGPVLWQRTKVESIFPGVRTLYTGDLPKGSFVQDALSGATGPSCFVDDTVEQLDSVAEHAPQVQLFEMRRDGQPGSGKYPVVRSLSELP